MGNRIIRTGKVTHMGPLLKHPYVEGPDGVRTYTNTEYVVQVVVEIQDGPDKGREVRIEMGTLEALFMSRNLEAARHETHDKQRALEAPETDEQTD